MLANGAWGATVVAAVVGGLLAAAALCGSAGNEAIALINVSTCLPCRQYQHGRIDWTDLFDVEAGVPCRRTVWSACRRNV